MKRTIRLTESDIHRIVKETVKRVLKEGTENFAQLYQETKKTRWSREIDRLMSDIENVKEEYEELQKRLKDIQQQEENEIYDLALDKYGIDLNDEATRKQWTEFCEDQFDREKNLKLQNQAPRYMSSRYFG